MTVERGAVVAGLGVVVVVELGIVRIDLILVGQMRSTGPPDLGLGQQARGRPVPEIRPRGRVDKVRPLAHTPRGPGVVEVYCGQQDCHNQERHGQDYGCGCALRRRHFSPVPLFGLGLFLFPVIHRPLKQGRADFGLGQAVRWRALGGGDVLAGFRAEGGGESLVMAWVNRSGPGAGRERKRKRKRKRN